MVPRISMFSAVLLIGFAIAGVSAVSVSASGREFVASKPGRTRTKALNTQIFKTAAGAIECTTATGSGEVTELKSLTRKEVITYSGCTGFGVIIKVSPAHFEFNANGSARLEEPIAISSESLDCEVMIEPQTLESLSYKNSAGKVRAIANVSGIHSMPTGGVCGTQENTEGSYTGKIEAELEGGTVEWK